MSVRLRHRNVPLLLLQGRERLLAHFRPLLNNVGITEQQWRIVRLLLETAPLEPKKIGEICGILSPSMAGILDRMDHLGYIKRARLPHDHRRVHVTPTARARRLAERLSPAIDEAYDRIESHVGPRLWTRVQDTLDELIAALPVPREGNSNTEFSSPMSRKRR